MSVGTDQHTSAPRKPQSQRHSTPSLESGRTLVQDSPTRIPQCSFCVRIGHTENKCWKKKDNQDLKKISTGITSSRRLISLGSDRESGFVPLTALIDTGSSVNIITPDAVKKIPNAEKLIKKCNTLVGHGEKSSCVIESQWILRTLNVRKELFSRTHEEDSIGPPPPVVSTIPMDDVKLPPFQPHQSPMRRVDLADPGGISLMDPVAPRPNPGSPCIYADLEPPILKVLNVQQFEKFVSDHKACSERRNKED
ncbi:hypothetical protein ADUPG1_007715 [Aduncisulcus paluster]|uniref:Peptidase A2 domain-containing protein n=1 Tax=Aduncisulcus paluster TaxID=2918883 RepID=A0ABQ5KPB2_9EUKA|nr:hypothetical protein ADUPG1_007715 [Aduncisulcus paluster]